MSGPALQERNEKASIDVITALWRFFTSSRWAALLLVLLALTAALFVLGAYPTDIRERPASGDLSIYVGLWLRLLFGLFIFTLVLRLVDRAEILFHFSQNVSRARAIYLDSQGAYRSPLQSGLADVEIRARIMQCPASWLVRTWQVSEDDKPILYAENLRSAVWTDWVLHLGCLVVLIGIFVTAQWGWREEQVTLAAGESYSLDHAPGYVLTVGPSAVAGQTDDASTTGKMAVTVTSPQGEARGRPIAPFEPFLSPQFSIFQTSSGPALSISAKDGAGEDLLLQPFVKGRGMKAVSVATMKFGDDEDEDYLFIPKPDIFLMIDRYEALPEEGYDSAVYLLRGYQGNQSSTSFSRYIERADTFQWNDMAFEVDPVTYVIVNVAGDTGWWIALAGLILLVLGSLARLWLPTSWLARFETESLDGSPFFERLVLWNGKGQPGTRDHMTATFLQCMGATDREL